MISSANCAEDETSVIRNKEDRTNAAIHFLKLISNDQLDLGKDTAISQHCSPKRRNELETRIERLRNNGLSDKDNLTVEAQLTDSNFAAVLVRADNIINPLNTRIYPVALLKRNNRWVPAPLLGSFSNTGYGYDIESERSVKKLETWMGQQKVLNESKHIKKTKSGIKSKIIKIEQEAGLAEMNSEQIATYFLKQCRDKNTLAIIASIGSASAHAQNQLGDDIELVSKALQLSPTSTSDWHYLSQACIAKVIETDEKTGKVIIGCFDPKESMAMSRYAFRTINLQTDHRNGKKIIRLPGALSEVKTTLRRRYQRVDPRMKDKIASTIFKQKIKSQFDTPGQLLERFTRSLEDRNFGHFLELTVRENEHSKDQDTLHQIAQFWNKLSTHQIQTPLNSDVAANKLLALATVEYRQAGSSHPFKKEELWMIKNDDSWHISPASMLQSSVLEMVGDAKNKAERESEIESMIDMLRQQMHEKWLKAIFHQITETTLPLSIQAPSDDEAQKTLNLFHKHLLDGNMKACLSQCFILENSDKNKIIERTKRLIRGAHDQIADIEILGISKKGGWVGISTKATSKLSKLNDYPLYLFANTLKGPRLFANTDFRYPRNSGRKFLNEQHWQQLKESAPQQTLTTLRAIFDEHIQRCDHDIITGKD